MTTRDLRRALSHALLWVPVMTIVGWIAALPAWSTAEQAPNALVGAAYGAVVGLVISLVAAFTATVTESLRPTPSEDGDDPTARHAEQRASRDAILRTFPGALLIMAFAAGVSALSPAVVGRLAPAVGLAAVVLLYRTRAAANRADLTLDP